MSNIARYEQHFDDMIVSNQGDYVLFEDVEQRIEMLEKRIEELEMRLKAGFDPMDGE